MPRARCARRRGWPAPPGSPAAVGARRLVAAAAPRECPQVGQDALRRIDGRWNELDTTRVQLTPPAAVRLLDAVPNPFNPVTRIGFELDHETEARVEVYDLAGRRLATVAAGRHAAGRHTVIWHGDDDSGRPLPSGTYLVRLVADSAVRSQKVMLAR